MTTVDTQWVDETLIDLPSYGRLHRADAVQTLATDMDKNGQLQPVILCKQDDGRFELVVGKGRLEAARSLGWKQIRAEIRELLEPVRKLAIVAAENEAREDACPFYTAMLYKKMMDVGGLTQEALADQIGRNQTHVSRFLMLAAVPTKIWLEHQTSLTSLALCLEIARATDPEHQQTLVNAAVKDGLGAAAIKKLAKGLQRDSSKEAKAPREAVAFAFSWKGNAVVIKPRPYQPHAEPLSVYLNELEAAYNDFMSTQSTHAA